VNRKACEKVGYDYVFKFLHAEFYPDMDPRTGKVLLVNDFLNNTNYDVVVFLDGDAWVYDPEELDRLVTSLVESDTKHACFSRDPYIKGKTYVNSGSFIIKNNDYIKKMYANMTQEILSIDPTDKTSLRYQAWHDQHFISKYVYDNKNVFKVFVPNLLNTPEGIIIKHNWYRDKRMFDSMYELIQRGWTRYIDEKMDFDLYIDTLEYPNTATSGYEYA
jgi:hypothetical protein